MSAIVLGSASQLNAERIFFANGRTMSVKDYHIAGDVITVTLCVTAGKRRSTSPSSLASNPTRCPRSMRAVIAAARARRSATSAMCIDARPFADLIETVALKHGIDPGSGSRGRSGRIELPGRVPGPTSAPAA